MDITEKNGLRVSQITVDRIPFFFTTGGLHVLFAPSPSSSVSPPIANEDAALDSTHTE